MVNTLPTIVASEHSFPRQDPRTMAYGCDLTRVFTYEGSEKDSLINCETHV